MPNLPEVLLQGRERTYIEYFINKLSFRVGAFTPETIQRYANAYSQPGAIRCALDLYRAFDKDAEDLELWVKDKGRCKIPCLVLSGEYSKNIAYAQKMAIEVVEPRYLSKATVSAAGHFISEENPNVFVEIILAFAQRQDKHPLITPMHSWYSKR